MLFRKNTTANAPEGEAEDLQPVPEENLDAVNGAGNPWEGVPGVPQQSIDEELRKRG
jgi:hypothetical protein